MNTIKIKKLIIDELKIESFKVIASNTEKTIYDIISSIYGNSILIISNDKEHFNYELNILLEFKGQAMARILYYNRGEFFFLEEKITPATTLKQVEKVENRVLIFCELYRKMNVYPSGIYHYKTYLEWTTKITNFLSDKPSHTLFFNYMKKANFLCTELFNLFPIISLLHGDLHHENILLNSNDEYISIDPKGVLGNKIFDISRFLLNELKFEFDKNNFEKMIYIINLMHQNLNIDILVLKKLLFIDTTLSQCWNIEDNLPISIEMIKFADELLLKE